MNIVNLHFHKKKITCNETSKKTVKMLTFIIVYYIIYKRVKKDTPLSGNSSAWQSAWFGTKMSQVRILFSRPFLCRYSLMAELQPSKLFVRVRFSLPAPKINQISLRSEFFHFYLKIKISVIN